jgi:hypothetical protein
MNIIVKVKSFLVKYKSRLTYSVLLCIFVCFYCLLEELGRTMKHSHYHFIPSGSLIISL